MTDATTAIGPAPAREPRRRRPGAEESPAGTHHPDPVQTDPAETHPVETVSERQR